MKKGEGLSDEGRPAIKLKMTQWNSPFHISSEIQFGEAEVNRSCYATYAAEHIFIDGL